MARVFFTQKAREDLINIWLYAAKDNPQAADRVLNRLDEAARHLARHPKMGAARDDIRPGMRCQISGAYLLLYRITGAGVEIVRAVHSRRDLFSLL